ncbi:hypothetical protein F441_08116 [Phytophthora nicotianae CJ01A1]|uniref:Uncharacterized protein n=2 Tax=Phytophthora nicotianae TaxID=4792 RepID=W2X4P1_PHYNI|nr:hypothetical protein F444_08194 [Phytophthora nicotianae P1976]ETP17492.1 hypothetical protein F441_08116 [Phytophthora nicotianae CJ01A1]
MLGTAVRETAQDLEPLGAIAPGRKLSNHKLLRDSLCDYRSVPLVLGMEELLMGALKAEVAAGGHT